MGAHHLVREACALWSGHSLEPQSTWGHSLEEGFVQWFPSSHWLTLLSFCNLMTYNPYLLIFVYALSHILLEGLIGTVPSVWTWKKRFFLFSTYFLPNAGIPFLSTPSQDSISLNRESSQFKSDPSTSLISLLKSLSSLGFHDSIKPCHLVFLTWPQWNLIPSLNGQKMAHLISKFSKIVTTSATIQTDDPNSHISKTSLLSTLIPASDQWVQY